MQFFFYDRFSSPRDERRTVDGQTEHTHGATMTTDDAAELASRSIVTAKYALLFLHDVDGTTALGRHTKVAATNQPLRPSFLPWLVLGSMACG